MNKEAFKYTMIKQFKDVESDIHSIMLNSCVYARRGQDVYCDSLTFLIDEFDLLMHIERHFETPTRFDVRFEDADEVSIKAAPSLKQLEEHISDMNIVEEWFELGHQDYLRFSLRFSRLIMEDYVIKKKFTDTRASIYYFLKTRDFTTAVDSMTDALETWKKTRLDSGTWYLDYASKASQDLALINYLKSSGLAEEERLWLFDLLTTTLMHKEDSSMTHIVKELKQKAKKKRFSK